MSGEAQLAGRKAVREVLLVRRGLVFVDPRLQAEEPVDETLLQAVDLELEALGYAPSSRLRARFASMPVPALAERRRQL